MTKKFMLEKFKQCNNAVDYMKVIMQLCSRIAVLNQGIKIAEGAPQEISRNEEVIAVYLGKKREKNAQS